MTEIADLTF